MICCVEWKRLFSALKNLQNRLYRGMFQNPIFLRNLYGETILIFISQVGLKSGVWKTASFYPPVFPDCFIALEAI